MRLSSRRFKFLGISILALLIFIPLIVFGDTLGGFRSFSGNRNNAIPVFHYADNSLSSIAAIGTCVQNTSGNDYFVPTRTINEWNNFFSHQPSGIALTTCCGDGACNGSESCSSCPSECGSCACQYIYSDWTACNANTGANRTRTIVSYGPTNCTGTPEPLSVACCAGCLSGTCMDQVVYNGTSCLGSAIATNRNMCTTDPLNTCFVRSPMSSKDVSDNGCYHECHTIIAGCKNSGDSCRSSSVYVNNASCSGGPTTTVSNTCEPTNIPNGTCLDYLQSSSVHVGVIYTAATGCSYYND